MGDVSEAQDRGRKGAQARDWNLLHSISDRGRVRTEARLFYDTQPFQNTVGDQRGLPKLLEHGYARPQVLRVRRLGTNNQRPKAGGTFIDVQLKGAFQYPTSSRGPEGCYKSVNCNVKPSTASPLRILR